MTVSIAWHFKYQVIQHTKLLATLHSMTELAKTDIVFLVILSVLWVNLGLCLFLIFFVITLRSLLVLLNFCFLFLFIQEVWIKIAVIL